MKFILLFLSAALVNNFVLRYFLGICPFLGVTGRVESAVAMGLATTMAGIREQLDFADVPEPLQGAAITLITAGLLALAFMGFTGLITA